MNLPWRPGELGELLHLAMTGVPEAGSAETPFELHVLVVEDNRLNQMLLQREPEKCGSLWLIADDGAAAVAGLSREPNIEVVSRDLHMPGVDG